RPYRRALQPAIELLGNAALEAPAAPAAKPAARRAAPAEARSAAAARCRRHHRARLRRHVIEAVAERTRIETPVVDAGLEPRRRLGIDVLKRADPFFLDAQGHRKRQEFFKGFGRAVDAVHAICFYVREEILEAKHACEGFGAACCAGRHEPPEANNN